jgi:XTP/dITP diphosphohydrolase
MKQRIFKGNKLVIASHNEGKIREIKELLKPLKIDVVSSKDLKIIEPNENGISFEENALIKSTFSSKQSGFPSLSDDSGICFPDLNNSPGIYSARWAGKNKDFSLAMLKIYHGLRKLKKPVNNCFFICSLSLAWPDGFSVTVSGKVKGIFIWPPKGEKGFGYDPIFKPLGHDITFAEMKPDFKHSISHRSFAFKKLVDVCFPTLKTL